MFSKLVFSDLGRKPVNTVLIIIAVALTVSVLYCALSFNSIVAEFCLDTCRAEHGDYNVEVSSNSATGSNLVQLAPLKEFEGTEYVVGSLVLQATFDSEVVRLAGYDTGETDILNPIEVLQSCRDTLAEMPQDHVIICRTFADEHNLKLYDAITVRVLSKTQTLYVGCIAEDSGYFFDNTSLIIGNARHFGRFIGWSGGNVYNRVYIKCADGTDADQMIAEIKAMPEYSTLDVEKYDLYASATSDSDVYTMLFGFSSVLVSLLIAAVLFALAEIRLSSKTAEAAQLQIIGATPTKVMILYLCRFSLLGVIGVLLGSFAGVGLLSVIIRATILPRYAVQNVGYVFAAAALAFAILILSAIVPVVRVVKNGIGKSLFSSKITSYKPHYIAAACFAAAFTVLTTLTFTVTKNQGVIGLLNVIAICGLVIFGFPVVLHGFGKLLAKRSQGAAHVAGLIVGRDKHLASGAVLLSLAMLVCVVTSSSMNIFNAYNVKSTAFKSSHIIVENLDNMTDEDYEYLYSLDGAVVRHYNIVNVVELSANGRTFNTDIYATDGLGCGDLYDFEYLSSLETAEQQLDENTNNIIVSEQFLYCYDLHVGDAVTVNYKGKKVDFVISGYMHSIRNHSSIALVNYQYFADAFSTVSVSRLYIATDDISGLSAQITDKLSEKDVYVGVLSSSNGVGNKAERNVATFFNYFVAALSAMIIIVVCFYIFLSDSFRKKEYARYEVQGLSNKSLAVLCLIESLSVAVLAVIFSAAVSVPLVQSTVNTMIFSDYYFGRVFYWVATVFVPLGFAGAFLLARLAAFLSERKKNDLVLFKEL